MNTTPRYRTVIETDQPLAEILDACVHLADRVERGGATSIEKATLLAHLRVLRDDLDLTAESEAVDE